MSGVLRSQVLERTSIFVVVTGVHLTAISIAVNYDGPGGGDGDTRRVALVPFQPLPVAELPLMQARYDLPRTEREIHPPVQPVVGDLETDLALGDVDSAPEVTPVAYVEKPSEPDTTPVSDTFPLPSPSAQTALRNLVCGRLSNTTEAACSGWDGSQRMQLAAEIAPDPWQFEAENLPVALPETAFLGSDVLEAIETFGTVKIETSDPLVQTASYNTPSIDAGFHRQHWTD